MTVQEETSLDIATLPLADGRQVAVPLLTLAEVQQYTADEEEEGLGSLLWRGHELPIQSLEEFCGLPAQPRETFRTVGIFRAGKDSGTPFRALAFSGLAAYQRVERQAMQTTEAPGEGKFTAAATIGGQTLLVPNLQELLYA